MWDNWHQQCPAELALKCAWLFQPKPFPAFLFCFQLAVSVTFRLFQDTDSFNVWIDSWYMTLWVGWRIATACTFQAFLASQAKLTWQVNNYTVYKIKLGKRQYTGFDKTDPYWTKVTKDDRKLGKLSAQWLAIKICLCHPHGCSS